MVWGKSNSNVATYGSASQRIRTQQIDALLRAHPSTKALDLKRTAFDIPLRLPGISSSNLRIMLPGRFPEVAPVISLMPASLSHPLLDNNNHVVAHPKLARWSSHVHVGHLVTDIIEKLKQEPPTFNPNGMDTGGACEHPDIPVPTQPLPQQQSQPQPQPTQPMATAGGNQGHSAVQEKPAAGRPTGTQVAPIKTRSDSANVLFTNGKEFDKPARQHTTQLPPVPTSFPSLCNMTTEELNNLAADKDMLQAFVASLDVLGNMQSLENELKEDIPQQAERILSMKEEIETRRENVERLRAECTVAQTVFNEKTQRQQVVMERFAPKILVKQLSDAASHADNESEETAHQFLSGNLSIEDFLKQYQQERQLHHLRKSKGDVFRRNHVR